MQLYLFDYDVKAIKGFARCEGDGELRLRTKDSELHLFFSDKQIRQLRKALDIIEPPQRNESHE